MTSDQKYEGKGDSANQPAQNSRSNDLTVTLEGSTAGLDTSTPQPPHTVTITWASPNAIGPPALTIPNTCFADSFGDAEYIDNVRQAIRSWFTCWIPEEVRTEVHGPTEQQGTIYFQDVDEFLGNLATAAFKYQEAAKIAKDKQVKELLAMIQRANENTSAAIDTTRESQDLLARAIQMLESADIDTTSLTEEAQRIIPVDLTSPNRRSNN